MSVSVKFGSAAELNRSIQILSDLSGQTAQDTIKKQARLLCVDLAANTLPAGKGKQAQINGKEFIRKKISNIYIPVGVAYEILETHKEGYGKAFLMMVKKGKLAEAGPFLSKYSRKKFIVGQFDGGDLHRSQAFKKIRKRMVVTDFSKVDAYIKKVQRRVGFAKGGFAAAARDLGGHRGIPGFATRQNSPGSAVISGQKNNFSITITNRVKHIREALGKDGEAKALSFRARQIGEVIKRIMNRKTKRVSRSLK